MKRSISSCVRTTGQKHGVSSRHGFAEQRFTKQFVDRDHESPNRRHTKRQRRRRQELLRQRHQRRRRALAWALVQQPPQKHRQMDQVQKPAERFRPAAASAHRSLPTTASSNTCCTRSRENAVLAEKMPSSGSPTRTGVSARSATRCGSSTSRLVFRAKMKRSRHLSGRHVRRLARVVRRQFVVERDDHGLLARESSDRAGRR